MKTFTLFPIIRKIHCRSFSLGKQKGIVHKKQGQPHIKELPLIVFFNLLYMLSLITYRYTLQTLLCRQQT